MTLRNIKLTICYDGSNYHGWQVQHDVVTVQQRVTEAIEKLCRCSVQLTGASRTDTGVHALGQVANFRIDTPVPTANFARALTEILPDDIAVSQATDVPESFDAISDAKGKLYRYTIFTSKVRPVMSIKQCWHYPGDLDGELMENRNPSSGLLSNWDTITIGSRDSTGSNAFSGTIDEVMVFNQSLTLEQIQQLYWNGVIGE